MADVWPVTVDANRVECDHGGLLDGWIATGSLRLCQQNWLIIGPLVVRGDDW